MILLDTPAIIYDALDTSRIPQDTYERINHAERTRELIISDVSIWEITILIKNGQLRIDETASNFIHLYFEYRNPEIISIRPEISELAEKIDAPFQDDPFDRIIAATAIIQGATIATPDERLSESTLVQSIWD